MRVRTPPRYGVFMGIGAVLFALIGWGVSANVEPGLQADGTRIDTTPVIGLMVVVGFVVGATIGALAAIVLDFFVGRKSRVMTAERTHLVTEEEDLGGADETGAGDEPRASDASDESDDTSH